MSRKNEPVILGGVPPSDKETEMAVLGGLMVDKNAVYDVVDKLNPSIFYYSPHQLVCKNILELFRDSKPIDLLTVTEQAKKNGDLEAIGGPYYLVDLTNRVASSANIRAHFMIIVRTWIAREMIQSGNDMLGRLYANEDPLVVMDEVESLFMKLTAEQTTRMESAAAVADAMLERSRKIFDKGGKMIGMPLTGIDAIDNVLGGGEPADVIVFGGRPKSGKSSISTNIGMTCVLNDEPLYNGSGEMQNIKAGYRLAAALSGIPTSDIRKGAFFDKEKKELMESFNDAYEKIKKSKIIFDEGPLSIPKMKADVKRLYREGVRIFLYDRIMLFKEVLNGKDKYQEITNVTAAMRSLANETGAIIVPYIQLSGDAERSPHKRPDARHMFGATGAQANVTKAMLIYRPEMYGFKNFEAGPYEGQVAKGLAEVFLVLSNDYELRSAKVGFDGPCQCFRPFSSDLKGEDVSLESGSRESPTQGEYEANFEGNADLPF